jgi:alpha-tubulin suppressor-like RCC1 family protein
LIGDRGALYTWGNNKKGQLGHSNTGISEVKLKATKVSCGFEYTICLTEDFKLMVTGQLPFEVNNKNCLERFEQLAKFEKSVNVK